MRATHLQLLISAIYVLLFNRITISLPYLNMFLLYVYVCAYFVSAPYGTVIRFFVPLSQHTCAALCRQPVGRAQSILCSLGKTIIGSGGVIKGDADGGGVVRGSVPA